MKKHIVITLLILNAVVAVLIGVLIKMEPAYGNPPSIVINEICPSGCAPSGRQWIEIYNAGSEPLDLEQWKFYENETNHALSISPSSSIKDWIVHPGQYAVIAQNDDAFFQDHPHVSSTVFDSSWSILNKRGEQIGLRTDARTEDFVELFIYPRTSSTSIERLDPATPADKPDNWLHNPYGSTPGQENYWHTQAAATNTAPTAVITATSSVHVGQEVEFDSSASFDPDGTIEQYQWYVNETLISDQPILSHLFTSSSQQVVTLKIRDNNQAEGTDSLIITITDDELALATGTESAVIDYGGLKINEVVSDPVSGGNEWVEIHNNTTSSIKLDGLLLNDGVGTIANLEGTIEAKQFFLIVLSSSKLNNSGDIITLTKGAGQTIDTLAYGDWQSQDQLPNAPAANDPFSLARIEDGHDTDNHSQDFALTTLPTPAAPNHIASPISDQKKQTDPSDSDRDQDSETGEQKTEKSDLPLFHPGAIVINEIVSDPIKGHSEFVELYNRSEDTIQLEGWYLQEGGGSKTALNGVIHSKSFYAIDDPKGNLNNDGDNISIYSPNEKLIDSLTYGKFDDGDLSDNAPLASDPYSLCRIKDGQDTDNDRTDFAISASVTKNAINLVTHPGVNHDDQAPDKSNSETSLEQTKKQEQNLSNYLIQDFLDIKINEFLPNPEGTDDNEFIELYNSGQKKKDLSGLFLDDQEGGSKPFTFPENLSLEPNQYLVLFKQETGLSLNNSADSVRLMLPDGKIIQQVRYETSKNGLSFSKIGSDQWDWTPPSPGHENQKPLRDNESKKEQAADNKKNKIQISVDIPNIRQLKNGTPVKTTGIASALPNVLGSQYFYILAPDGSSGVQVYSYKKDFPELKLGDLIRVSGEISQSGGETRIKTKQKKDITVLEHKGLPQATAIDIEDIGERHEGRLVQISGEITEVKGSYMYADDGSEEIKIYFKKNTGIDKNLFEPGYLIKLSGIVQQTKKGYQILPRSSADIVKTGAVEELVEKKEEISPTESKRMAEKYLTATAGGLTSILIGLGARSKADVLKKAFGKIYLFLTNFRRK